ncbi:hypothetical protein [Klebsiella variicola]|uniref:hypothetical protein n=1 Tax=Klebsiella variicola TaxID=244366 RepID=UPI0034DEB78E
MLLFVFIVLLVVIAVYWYKLTKKEKEMYFEGVYYSAYQGRYVKMWNGDTYVSVWRPYDVYYRPVSVVVDVPIYTSEREQIKRRGRVEGIAEAELARERIR